VFVGKKQLYLTLYDGFHQWQAVPEHSILKSSQMILRGADFLLHFLEFQSFQHILKTGPNIPYQGKSILISLPKNLACIRDVPL
jgi:hypothetical protein